MTAYVYDLEIKKAIPPKDPAARLEDIEYCAGWRDFENMGISVLGVANYHNGSYRAYLDDNLKDFLDTVNEYGDLLVGFNNLAFDDQVITAAYPEFGQGRSKEIDRYDILREIWLAEGLPPTWRGTKQAGYTLNDMALINGLSGKIGNGAEAPIDWQRGHLGKLITYCLDDVHKTLHLYRRIQELGELNRPYAKGGGIIKMPKDPTPL